MRRVIAAIISAFCLLIPVIPAHCQSQGQINRAVFDRVLSEDGEHASDDMPALTVRIARSLYGTPYVASTLETVPETLNIYLDKTDCILFVETCVALAWTLKGLGICQGGERKAAEPSYELFCRNIQNLRYRDGIVDGYPSRLHYTSEWIRQAERNGVMKEISSDLGEVRPQAFNFMSTHRDSYAQLRTDDANLVRISQAEKALEAAGPYSYISQARLQDPAVISQIHDGDIIAFVSKVKGLDITHVAIACGSDGRMHFIHASSKAGKVILEPRTLADYAANGIRLIRLNP